MSNPTSLLTISPADVTPKPADMPSPPPPQPSRFEQFMSNPKNAPLIGIVACGVFMALAFGFDQAPFSRWAIFSFGIIMLGASGYAYYYLRKESIDRKIEAFVIKAGEFGTNHCKKIYWIAGVAAFIGLGFLVGDMGDKIGLKLAIMGGLQWSGIILLHSLLRKQKNEETSLHASVYLAITLFSLDSLLLTSGAMTMLPLMIAIPFLGMTCNELCADRRGVTRNDGMWFGFITTLWLTTALIYGHEYFHFDTNSYFMTAFGGGLLYVTALKLHEERNQDGIQR